VLVEEMDASNYYTSHIGAWEMGVGMDAYFLGPAQAIAPDSASRAGLLASVSAIEDFLAAVHTE
jgi:methyl-accepting chemotaxis protein